MNKNKIQNKYSFIIKKIKKEKLKTVRIRDKTFYNLSDYSQFTTRKKINETTTKKNWNSLIPSWLNSLVSQVILKKNQDSKGKIYIHILFDIIQHELWVT